jgi:hypothetical protein
MNVNLTAMPEVGKVPYSYREVSINSQVPPTLGEFRKLSELGWGKCDIKDRH